MGLNEELEDLQRRLSALEVEVRLLREQLRGKSADQRTLLTENMQTRPVKPKETIQPEQPVLVTAKETPLKSNQSSPAKEIDFEKVLSTWLPRVFMFILLLGVLWGLKVGIDYGFVSPVMRIGMGYVGTIILYILGMRYYNRAKKGFGLTLLGGLIALGILTTFAAHHLYSLLNFIFAFIIGMAYIGIGVWLSSRTHSETLTIFSAIAGFLLPFLLEGEGATAIQFCSYILLLFLSLFYLSLSQKHRYTFYITFLLFHLTLGVYLVLEWPVGEVWILVGTVLIQHGTILFFYLNGSIERQVFTEALLYTNFVFTIGWIQLLETNEEVVVYGLFALLYIALVVYLTKREDRSLQSILLAIAVFAVSVFLLAFNFDDERIRLLSFLLTGTIGLWVGFRFQTMRSVIVSSCVYIFTILAIFTWIRIDRWFSLDHFLWIAFLASVGWVFYTLYRYRPSFMTVKAIDQSLIAALLIVIAYVNQLTTMVLRAFPLGVQTEKQIELFVIMLLLGVLYVYGRSWHRGLYVMHASLIIYLLLGLVLLPLSYDAGHFIVSFSIQMIYASGIVVIFRALWKKRFYLSVERLKVQISQLAVMVQIYLFIVLNKWYFLATKQLAWNWEFVLFGQTFSWFAFAFLSISLGTKQRWRIVKIIGAALIGLTMVKLFVVDLASISILVRAILFTIVGIVGLIYSRTLVKDD